MTVGLLEWGMVIEKIKRAHDENKSLHLTAEEVQWLVDGMKRMRRGK